MLVPLIPSLRLKSIYYAGYRTLEVTLTVKIWLPVKLKRVLIALPFRRDRIDTITVRIRDITSVAWLLQIAHYYLARRIENYGVPQMTGHYLLACAAFARNSVRDGCTFYVNESVRSFMEENLQRDVALIMPVGAGNMQRSISSVGPGTCGLSDNVHSNPASGPFCLIG